MRLSLFRTCMIGLAVAVVFAARMADSVFAALDRIFTVAAETFARTFPTSMTRDPASGFPLDAALQNGLRHEAGMSRRSAARNV